MKRHYPLLLCLVLFVGCVSSKMVVKESHYANAENFLLPNLAQKVYHVHVQPQWLADSLSFWHVTQTPQGKRFFLTCIADRQTTLAFDHDSLARHLMLHVGKHVDPANLPLGNIGFIDQDHLTFSFDKRLWQYHIPTHALQTREPEPSPLPGLSPDGRWQAFARDYNLYIRDLQTQEEFALSTQGAFQYEYANTYGWYDLMVGEGGKRPENFFVQWSPDSRKILTYITDLRTAQKMYLLDFAQDTLFRPRLLSYYRGSPGDTTLVYHIPVIFNLADRSQVKIDLPPIPHFNGVNFRWYDTSDSLYALFPHRGYKQADMIKVDAQSGEVEVLISERSDTSVEYGSLMIRRVGADKLIFSSQKSGWHHLYLYDWHHGQLLSTLTQGEYVVKALVHIDEANEQVYFLAAGLEPGRNPYYDHLYRVNFDGTGLLLLTPENAQHVISLSPCKQYFVDNYSTVNQPTVSVLRKLNTGEIVHLISEAQIHDLLAMGWTPPIPFMAKGRDGQTDIHGILYPPLAFDSRKKYPIIDYTYTGPHTAITPKTFSAALFNIQNPLRAFGFAVVVVDGLGTANRSKGFRDFSYQNLGGNMECHVLAIRQLAQTWKWVDTTRVGVYGHSAGGYDAARAMLMYPDFYKVGVASAADHDHRMEKAWWPEMYMGYPVGEVYHLQSNITNAHNLKGHLLIAHGAVDENVNPSATYKLAEYFIRAQKDFDMLILPAVDHSFGRSEGDYFTKIRWNYFIRHLLPAQPIHHYQFKTILQD